MRRCRTPVLPRPYRCCFVAPSVILRFSVALLLVVSGSESHAQDGLVAIGERIFMTETFGGNGRTCATCHRPTDNFALSPAFIATLPDDDPLFVAEVNPNLRRNFENSRLLRDFGLILENMNRFSDLANDFNMRGVPHVLALRTSVASVDGPRTGWSGDGSPGDGSLRAFATGAVIQHFPKTLSRVADVDFRLPTEDELDALEAFLLSLGRQADLRLPLRLRDEQAERGQEIFLDDTLGKCNVCHFNAGANADRSVFGGANDNRNFNTGVEDLPDHPADRSSERMPPDDGFGAPGNGEFNTPPLVEAADTGPFFHNNVVTTIEEAVAFYNSAAFSNSPAGRALAAGTDGGIRLDRDQVLAVAAFLRVINALENIRSSSALAEEAAGRTVEPDRAKALLQRARSDAEDAAQVLREAGLHMSAVTLITESQALLQQAEAATARRERASLIEDAIESQGRARRDIVR
jgi:mono/diheme cytochrome c family protein